MLEVCGFLKSLRRGAVTDSIVIHRSPVRFRPPEKSGVAQWQSTGTNILDEDSRRKGIRCDEGARYLAPTEQSGTEPPERCVGESRLPRKRQ